MRSGREEPQATSCPHRVLRCPALPCPAPPPPPQDFLLPSSRDRPFRAQTVNSSAPQLPCSSAPLPVKPAKDCLSQCFCSLSLSILAGSPHGIRHILHVRVSPRRHLDIGQAWWEQPRHHPTSAVPSTRTATATSTTTSTPYTLGRTRALAESINDRFTDNLTLTHPARSQPGFLFFSLSIQSPPSLLSSPPYQLPALATARRLWPSSWYTTRA